MAAEEKSGVTITQKVTDLSARPGLRPSLDTAHLLSHGPLSLRKYPRETVTSSLSRLPMHNERKAANERPACFVNEHIFLNNHNDVFTTCVAEPHTSWGKRIPDKDWTGNAEKVVSPHSPVRISSPTRPPMMRTTGEFMTSPIDDRGYYKEPNSPLRKTRYAEGEVLSPSAARKPAMHFLANELSTEEFHKESLTNIHSPTAVGQLATRQPPEINRYGRNQNANKAYKGDRLWPSPSQKRLSYKPEEPYSPPFSPKFLDSPTHTQARAYQDTLSGRAGPTLL